MTQSRMTVVCAVLVSLFATRGAAEITVEETDEQIKIVTPRLEAVVRKRGYVTGVAGGSFVDRKTGFRDAGFGLDIVDWIMEPGSDEGYRDQLPKEMVYEINNPWHGKIAKRSIEGPQICTQAKELQPQVIRGKDFVAVKMRYKYRTASPGKKVGSVWEQVLVFPEDTRYFISSDKITSVNDGEAPFLRLDMPGHIKHRQADTFSQIYLSYEGIIPASEFLQNFPPEEKFRYVRKDNSIPDRFIRAYQLRDSTSGKQGPWLAGMTLEPKVVSEAWCHQRDYVCMIEEFGGRPVRAGESFGAAFVVGFFDSVQEMEQVFDRHAGHDGLTASPDAWKLIQLAK